MKKSDLIVQIDRTKSPENLRRSINWFTALSIVSGIVLVFGIISLANGHFLLSVVGGALLAISLQRLDLYRAVAKRRKKPPYAAAYWGNVYWKLVFADDPKMIAELESIAKVTQVRAVDAFINDAEWRCVLPNRGEGTPTERLAALREAYQRQHKSPP